LTDLSRFEFWLYDSVDQGLVKTLILAVDGDTGETVIGSRSEDGSSDYLNINQGDIDIHDENINCYSEACSLRNKYQDTIDSNDFESPKLQLRINHLNNVISRFTEWFMENGHSIPDPREIVTDADEITNSSDARWAIADNMRDRKEDGEFSTYMDAYRWAARNMRQNNRRFTAKSLENAFHKAKSAGLVD